MTLPAWVPSGQLKPAPQPLLLVQAFINTKDFDLGTDLLAEPGPANDWLHQAALLDAGIMAGPADLRATREAREGIRALLARNSHAGQLPDGGLGAGSPGRGVRAQFPDGDLGALAQAAQPRLGIGPDGRVQLVPGTGGLLGGGLARLLLIMRDAQQDGTWPRLKVCVKPDCRWAFYDRSHSRAGTWCDMASCGNTVKNRNLRARRGSRARSTEPAGPAEPAAT